MSRTMIRNEIGSEFWDVPLSDTEQIRFPGNTRWFISGTSALQYILRDAARRNHFTRAAVPSWCCSSMIEPFVQQGMKVCFYSVCVDENGLLTCDYTTAPPCDVTLVLSYFGYACQATKGAPSGILIRDLTHSLFCEKRQDADYSFGSLRKWAGFWTGGYAWKQGNWEEKGALPALDPAYEALRKGAMESKRRYLEGADDTKAYLKDFERAEEYLDQCGIMGGSPRDITIAPRFDEAAVRKIRKQNAEILLKAFRDCALFPTIGDSDCPLFVPILLNRDLRDGLRCWLIDNHVYCPVHWGLTDLHRLTDAQRALYEQELSLVCDQRYGATDMDRIVALAKEYLQDRR